MKKFLFLTTREWLVVLGIVDVIGGVFWLWIGHAKPICVLAETPSSFILKLKEEIKSGQQLSGPALLTLYSSDGLSQTYDLTVNNQQDHLILSFAPKAYDMGWGIHTPRFKYQFDTQALQTKVYDENGVCFYTRSSP